jgi:hypothetical protein
MRQRTLSHQPTIIVPPKNECHHFDSLSSQQFAFVTQPAGCQEYTVSSASSFTSTISTPPAERVQSVCIDSTSISATKSLDNKQFVQRKLLPTGQQENRASLVSFNSF